jgi:hypothetical protein
MDQTPWVSCSCAPLTAEPLAIVDDGLIAAFEKEPQPRLADGRNAQNASLAVTGKRLPSLTWVGNKSA